MAGMGRQGFGRRIVPRNMVPRWGTCPLKGALLTDPGGWHQRYPSCPPFLPEITGKRGMQGGELLETPPSVVANATVARSSPRSFLHRHPGDQLRGCRSLTATIAPRSRSFPAAGGSPPMRWPLFFGRYWSTGRRHRWPRPSPGWIAGLPRFP